MQQWTKTFNATWVPSCAGWATGVHSQGIPERLKQTQWLCLSWQLEATQGGEHTPMVWKRKIWGSIRHVKCTTLTCCSSSESAHILKSTGTLGLNYLFASCLTIHITCNIFLSLLNCYMIVLLTFILSSASVHCSLSFQIAEAEICVRFLSIILLQGRWANHLGSLYINV